MQDLIQDLLYKQINIRENMFVFTISNASTEDLKIPYMSDNFLSCFCVWFSDLKIQNNTLYKV